MEYGGLKICFDNPEGDRWDPIGCATTGVGVAGTAPETDVNFKNFLYGKFQTYVKVEL